MEPSSEGKLHQCLGSKLRRENNWRVCFEQHLPPAGWLVAAPQLQQILKWPKHQGCTFIKVV